MLIGFLNTLLVPEITVKALLFLFEKKSMFLLPIGGQGKLLLKKGFISAENVLTGFKLQFENHSYIEFLPLNPVI